MKTTDHFKRTIQAYLEQRTVEDELFAVTYEKADKNIDDCISSILNEVQRSGCNGFTDGEVYSMAVHYYDEDNIEVGKSMDCRVVVVNHVVKLTEEEKTEARQEAIKHMQKESYAKLTQPKKKTSSRQGSENENQMTLLF